MSTDTPASAQDGFIRINQVGLAPGEPGQAILITRDKIVRTFSVIDSNGQSVLPNGIPKSLEPWNGDFTKCYALEFAVHTRGEFRLRVGGNIEDSLPFRVGPPAELYGPLVKNAVKFFQAQRDGQNVITSVMNRLPSHLNDRDAQIFEIPEYLHDEENQPKEEEEMEAVLKRELSRVDHETIDASGGWFDAGDYLKFVETTSLAAGLMLFAARQFPNAADLLLAECAFGLDWLSRLWDGDDSRRVLCYQVGLGAGKEGVAGDHDAWRLPQEDDGDDDLPEHRFIKHRPVFRANRPAEKISPNLAGRVAAAFALGYQVFRSRDSALAKKFLINAEKIFDSAAIDKPDLNLLTTSPHKFYREKTWQEDMEWGAAELYFALKAGSPPDGLIQANPDVYLEQAAHFAGEYIKLKSPDTLNLYDVSGVAHYELHRALQQAGHLQPLEVTRKKLIEDLKGQLTRGSKLAEKDPFGGAINYDQPDDPVPHLLGLAITATLYKELTSSNEFEAFARAQRDWVLGKNAWGISFVIGAGTVFPKCPHHQVANKTKLQLDGGTVDGPVDDQPSHKLEEGMYACDDNNRFAEFNRGKARYEDTVTNSSCNEPAIDYTIFSLVHFAQLAASGAPHPDKLAPESSQESDSL